MSHRKPPPRELRLCLRCKHASFDCISRDVSDWLIIDDLDASDHCRSCWMELAITRGRPLGQPHRQLLILANVSVR